jgi:polar amino acid transport system substrate-binding protein
LEFWNAAYHFSIDLLDLQWLNAKPPRNRGDWRSVKTDRGRNIMKWITAGCVALLTVAGAALGSVSARSEEKKILELNTPGELIVGYDTSPWIFDVENGQGTGLFGLIMDEIAKRLGLKAVYRPLEFPALIPALQAGRIDVTSNLSFTQPRAQIIYYAAPFFLEPDGLAVRSDSDLKSWEDAAQHHETLATEVGYYYIGIWEKMGIAIHTFANVDACFMDVISKGSDGCDVGSLPVILSQATLPDGPAAKLKLVIMNGSPNMNADINSFGINKSHPVLADSMTRALVNMWRDGTMESIYRKSFGKLNYQMFMNSPAGYALYLPGPWEEGVTPPATTVYPSVHGVSPGKLTVGVSKGSALLAVNGDQVSGPEGIILQDVAKRLGLSLQTMSIADPVAALNEGKVDVVAGGVAETEEQSHRLWYTLPIAFNPDYIYVRPDKGGQFPKLASWEDVAAKGGKLAVESGSSRLTDLKKAGVSVLEVDNASAGLKAVADGTAQGFVGSSIEFVASVTADPKLVDIGLGWVRNNDDYAHGEAFAWGVKAGNAELLDGINQAITAAWQDRTIIRTYMQAFPRVDVTCLTAPGPTTIGTSYDSSKDYRFVSMFVAGPWLQRPSWTQ